MTLYEELGVSPDAPQDTIRDAYRNVARLLHPDAQTNPVLKESAEAQMKRINHLYETLSDPRRRSLYDQQLAEPAERRAPIIIQTRTIPGKVHPDGRGAFTWLAATIVCGSFVIWLASRDAGSPAVYPQPVSESPAGAALPASGSSFLPTQRGDEVARLKAALAAVNADRDRLARQLASVQTEKRFQPPPPELRQAQIPLTPSQPLPAPASLPAPTAIPDLALLWAAPHPAPPPAPARTNEPISVRWTGSWVYARSAQEAGSKALFPPEFIETVIVEQSGRLQGRYHARFRLSNPKISPNVDFSFDGPITGTSGQFFWTGREGAKGEVRLHRIGDAALEVVWAATELGRTMGLASGTAVLRRKD